MSRQIVIGDVHGCYAELHCLVNKLNLQPTDHLIFVGDLIHKGPDSPGVLDLILLIQKQTCRVTNLLGNHEEKFLRWLRHEEQRQSSGTMNPVKDSSKRMINLARSLSEQQIDLLRNAILWTPVIRAEDDSLRVIAVHAGIEPSLEELPDPTLPRQAYSSKEWRRWDGLVRTRWVDPKGNRVHLGEERTTDQFWSELYNGRFGVVIFGHESQPNGQIRRDRSAIGIDLGCVSGGHLAAIVFANGYPQWKR